MLTIDQIREVAVAARRALEAGPLRIGADDFDVTFAQFPRGACSDTCLLVAELYRRLGCSVQVLAGERSDPFRSHVWLAVEGVIVDLTADQFDGERQPAVFIAASSRWHAETWRPSSFSQSFAEYEEPWRSYFRAGLAALDSRMGRENEQT